jgi:hypothetical protein
VISGPQNLHKNFMKCPSEEFFEELKIRNALRKNVKKNVTEHVYKRRGL